MTDNDDNKKSAHSTRFKPGRSGNYKGRPKGTATADKRGPSTSAFEVILDKTFKVTRNGQEDELNAEEALQLRTYQDAIKGSKPARREILKMIAERDKWRSQNKKSAPRHIEFLSKTDPDNADEAMLILQIAALFHDPKQHPSRKPWRLEWWAVRAALSRRRGGQRLNDDEIEKIKEHLRNEDALLWPRRRGE